ncbi:septum formation initiator family protein [Cryobacterium sp. PAMC25264]|uniref:FtsB family cell division protein n=1 Tax=Cryobacterium sp. PAMC25264 TaxID=2861288 RepID=UPI001C63AC5D|nr:septum formation initiator family protein [Cryobacterium sp. PAMC25264]QYF72170.1 septum formation initiator family protein [Cryobacterium sp. PAMC25264]
MTPPRLPGPRRPAPRTEKPRTEKPRSEKSRSEKPRTEKPRTEKRPLQLATDETAVGSWLRGLRLSGFSFVMMGILVLAVVALAPNVRTYAEQRQQIDALSASVADQQAAVDKLKDERERWNDRTYVTTQARARLSYVMPGDISFLVINDTGQSVAGAADNAPVSTAIQDTDVDWVDSVFRSVMTAGLAPQEAAQ